MRTLIPVEYENCEGCGERLTATIYQFTCPICKSKMVATPKGWYFHDCWPSLNLNAGVG